MYLGWLWTLAILLESENRINSGKEEIDRNQKQNNNGLRDWDLATYLLKSIQEKKNSWFREQKAESRTWKKNEKTIGNICWPIIETLLLKTSYL